MPTVRHPKFVATIQLGQLLSGLMVAIPMIIGVAVAYSRFTSLEDRVVVLVSDVQKLAIDAKQSNVETRAEFGKLITEASGRQNVYAQQIRDLQRSDGVQETRLQHLDSSVAEQRKSNADLAVKIDGVRDSLAAIRVRLPGGAFQAR